MGSNESSLDWPLPGIPIEKLEESSKIDVAGLVVVDEKSLLRGVAIKPELLALVERELEEVGIIGVGLTSLSSAGVAPVNLHTDALIVPPGLLGVEVRSDVSLVSDKLPGETILNDPRLCPAIKHLEHAHQIASLSLMRHGSALNKVSLLGAVRLVLRRATARLLNMRGGMKGLDAAELDLIVVVDVALPMFTTGGRCGLPSTDRVSGRGEIGNSSMIFSSAIDGEGPSTRTVSASLST